MGKILEQAGPDLDFKKVTEVNGTDTERRPSGPSMTSARSIRSPWMKSARTWRQEAYEKRSLIARVAQPSASSTEVKAGKKRTSVPRGLHPQGRRDRPPKSRAASRRS